MKYIVNNSNDPSFNIALEEYCFKNLTQFDEIFFLWINQPTIVVGKHQNAIEEINASYVKDNNIRVVRRISGGGAVYHDYNNLNYTIISAKSDNNHAFDFRKFSVPVINTLKKLGVDASVTGRNDIEINGKKICGIAQAYHKGRVLHHGCILFNVDLSVLVNALNVAQNKIESKGVKSVRSRVTNIYDELEHKIDIHEFSRLLMEEMKQTNSDFSEYVLKPEEIAIINKLKDEKHANWDWIYGTAPDYNIRKDTKYPTGKISIYADVHESRIKQIKIYGDFFGILDIQDIEEKLIDIKYTQKDILEALKDINVADYFMGITKEELVSAICDL